MQKKMAEDVAKKMQVLDSKMKSGQVAWDVTMHMMQWCQVCVACVWRVCVRERECVCVFVCVYVTMQ